MPDILTAPTPAEVGTALESWNGALALTPAAAAIAEALETALSDPSNTALLPAEPYAIMQTSGSSGQGKLVVLPRSTLAYSARATNEALGGPGNWVCALPTHHIAGFQTVARPLLTGHRFFDAGKGTPDELAKCVSALDGTRTYLSLVPTQLKRLLDSPHAGTAAAFSAILVGGAGTASDLLERGRSIGLNLVTTYGMTETCGGCAYNGRPIGDTQITTGARGRITITGSVVAHGYLGASPFSGVFPTNDAGHLSDGLLRVTGRLDRAITTGGLTVLPEPIERELEGLGGGENVVVGIPDPYWGEKLVAVTENALGSPRAELKPLVEAVPQEFVTVAELGIETFPRLDSGKPDRVRLEKLLSRREEARRATE